MSKNKDILFANAVLTSMIGSAAITGAAAALSVTGDIARAVNAPSSQTPSQMQQTAVIEQVPAGIAAMPAKPSVLSVDSLLFIGATAAFSALSWVFKKEIQKESREN